jgi:hypothetical protein
VTLTASVGNLVLAGVGSPTQMNGFSATGGGGTSPGDQGATFTPTPNTPSNTSATSPGSASGGTGTVPSGDVTSGVPTGTNGDVASGGGSGAPSGLTAAGGGGATSAGGHGGKLPFTGFAVGLVGAAGAATTGAGAALRKLARRSS